MHGASSSCSPPSPPTHSCRSDAMAAILDDVRPVLKALSADSSSFLSAVQSALPADTDLLDAAQGPSLLTLKNAALLSYVHHLVLLSSARLRGRSLDATEGARMVRNLVELRLVLEKIRPVEGRMRGLIERLVRAAEEEEKRIREGRVDDVGPSAQSGAEEIDPLAFRPNVAALSAGVTRGGAKEDGQDGRSYRDRGDGIYRPPRMAPVVYNPEVPTGRKSAKERVAPRNAALLSDLSASMSANPYETSSGGVGVGGSGANSSARAKALARMQQYEEDNFTRLTMGKKDAKRRRRDEADVALGGAGLSSKRGRVGAGLEEEFGDLLRNSTDLRGAKRSSALQRSRTGGRSDDLGLDGPAGGAGVFQKMVRNDMKRRKSNGKRS